MGGIKNRKKEKRTDLFRLLFKKKDCVNGRSGRMLAYLKCIQQFLYRSRIKANFRSFIFHTQVN